VLNFLDLQWDDSVITYSSTAKKRENIATPSYNQVIKPLYSHASGRWKKYENIILGIDPVLEKWINRYNY